MHILSVEKLSQILGKKQILKSISVTADQGKVTALLGPNGAGKTTLLKSIIGLHKTTQTNKFKNTLQLKDQQINYWSIGKRVEHGLVYLPQHSSLFLQMTVIDNLILVYTYHPHWKNTSWIDFEKQVKELFKQTGLNCPFTQKANLLSGGQKRKLEVIRTILMNPKVVMFDEPFAGVDPKSIYELKDIFSSMATKQNIAVIISDHNVDQLLSIADYIYVIIDGKVVTSGGIKEILDDKHTRESYFGNQFYSEISQRFL